MDDRPNIILSPHFDDAVLSLGGFIARRPDRTVVATVFAGTPSGAIIGSWDRWSGFASAAEAMRARCAENRAALALLGMPASAIRNLDFLDRQYRTAPGEDPTLRRKIAESVREIVQESGGAVNLFAPASAWHPDHRLVTDAALDIAAAQACQGIDLFLYQDQPYAYLELRKRSPIPLRFADFALLDGVARRRCNSVLERRLLVFDPQEQAAKLGAIRQYASQFPFIGPFLYKMIRDFSHYQARAAEVASRYVEVVYRRVPGAGRQS